MKFPQQRFWGLIHVVSRLAAIILMAVWFGIVLLLTNLAVLSPVLVVVRLERLGARLGSDFGDRWMLCPGSRLQS